MEAVKLKIEFFSDISRVVADAKKNARASLRLDTAEAEAAIKKISAGFERIKEAGTTALAFNAVTESISRASDALSTMSAGAVGLDGATQKIKTLGGVAKAGAEDFKAMALSYSRDLPMTASQVQEGIFEALAAGIGGTQTTTEGLSKEVDAFIATASKLAVGGGVELAKSVDIMSSALNAYGDSATEAEKYSDVLFQTVGLGKLSMEELGSSLANVVPTAAAAGVGIDDIGAAMAQMTAKGIPAAQSSTKLNQLLLELQKPAAGLAPLLRNAGISAESLANEDLVTTLSKLKKTMDETGTSAANAFSSSEAGAAFNTLMSQAGEFQNFTDGIAGAAGATGDAYKIMSESISVQVESMKAKVDNFFTSSISGMGSLGAAGVVAAQSFGAILPQVTSLASLANTLPGLIGGARQSISGLFDVAKNSTFAKDVATQWLSFGSSIRTGAVNTAGFITRAYSGAAASLGIGLGKESSKATTLLSGFASKGGAIIGNFGKAISAVSKAAFGPWGAAIFLAIEIFQYLYNEFEPFRKVVDAVVGFAAEQFKKLWSMIMGAVDAVKSFLGFSDEAKKTAEKPIETKVQPPDAKPTVAALDRLNRDYEQFASTQTSLSDELYKEKQNILKKSILDERQAGRISESQANELLQKLEAVDDKRKGSAKKKSAASSKDWKDALDKQKSDLESWRRDVEKIAAEGVDIRLNAQLSAQNSALDSVRGLASRSALELQLQLRPQLDEAQLNRTVTKLRTDTADAVTAVQSKLADFERSTLEATKGGGAAARAAGERQIAEAREIANRQISELGRRLEEQITAAESESKRASAAATRQVATDGVQALFEARQISLSDYQSAITDLSQREAESLRASLSLVGASASQIENIVAASTRRYAELITSAQVSTDQQSRSLRQMALNYDLAEAEKTNSAGRALSARLQLFDLETQAEKEQLKARLDNMAVTEEEKSALFARLDEDRQRKRLDLERTAGEAIVQITSDTVGDAAGLFRENTAAYKVLAVAQATMATYLAVTKALAEVPWPLNLAQSAFALASGLANVAKISGVGFRRGGYTGDGAPDEPAGIVHRGEFVVPAHVTARNRGHLERLTRSGQNFEDYAHTVLVERGVLAAASESKVRRQSGLTAGDVERIISRQTEQLTARFSHLAAAVSESNALDVSVSTKVNKRAILQASAHAARRRERLR